MDGKYFTQTYIQEQHETYNNSLITAKLPYPQSIFIYNSKARKVIFLSSRRLTPNPIHKQQKTKKKTNLKARNSKQANNKQKQSQKQKKTQKKQTKERRKKVR